MTGHKSKNKNCSVITAETQFALRQGDYYLAVHDSVEPFELVDDDAWHTEPSVCSAKQNDHSIGWKKQKRKKKSGHIFLKSEILKTKPVQHKLWDVFK